jgi:hypothetical protein
MPTIEIPYTPQPRQRKFHECPADEVLYGGAAGGGKSYAILFDALANALDPQQAPCKIIIFRQSFPELERTLIRRSRELYPRELGKYNESKKLWTFINGSTIEFAYLEKESDLENYQGAEYDFIYFDELTHFTEHQYRYMKSRLRGANPNIHRQVKAATNPGGVGHAWVKKRFIDIGPPEQLHTVQETDDDGNPMFHPLTGKPVLSTRMFIPAKVYDNEILMKNDPNYIVRLMSLPDQDRKQLLEGDWDAFAGQMFSEWNRNIHVIKPFELPEHWTKIRAIDEGYNDPFVCQWWAFDEQGKAYLYREFKKTHLLASEQAEAVKALTPPNEKITYTVADTSMWSPSKDSGVSPAEIFIQHGVPLIPATKQRPNGWMRLREYMHVYETVDVTTGKKVMTTDLFVFDTCRNFISTVPTLVCDENNPEDIADGQDDHDADCARYALMSRPVRTKPPEPAPPSDPMQRWLYDMEKLHEKRIKSRKRRVGW